MELLGILNLIGNLNRSIMNKITLLLTLITFGIYTHVFAQQKLVHANNEFSIILFKAIKKDSSNLFISPFSLHMAFAIANEGARNTTREEINNFLHIDKEAKQVEYASLINATINLKDRRQRDCINWSFDSSNIKTEDSNQLHLANSVWINQIKEITESYRQSLSQHFKSEVFSFSENNLEVSNQILDEWMAEKTQNKITDAGQLEARTIMMIVNAIYFNGIWENSFDPNLTKKRKFHMLSNKSVSMDFMKTQANYKYYEDLDLQALSIPYECEQFSIYVLLPRKNSGILPLEKMLTYNVFKNIQNKMKRYDVILTLPKFRIETDLSPIEEIKRMGYTQMFSDGADFTGIADSLKINKVIHKTTFEVSERKTEAAAVSSIEIVVTGYGGGEIIPPLPPKVFNANHPFVFFIQNNRTGAILFIGRFTAN